MFSPACVCLFAQCHGQATQPPPPPHPTTTTIMGGIRDGRRPPDKVNRRVVHILLECILVIVRFFSSNLGFYSLED